nr:hypothetical protein [Tanacetum cinerariifolium]
MFIRFVYSPSAYVSSRKKSKESSFHYIVASTSELDDVHSSAIDNKKDISNISLVTSHLAYDFLESKSVPEEAGVPYSSEDETDLRDKESVSVDSVADPADDRNGVRMKQTYEGEKELKEREAESVNIESKDLTPVFVPVVQDENILATEKTDHYGVHGIKRVNKLLSNEFRLRNLHDGIKRVNKLLSNEFRLRNLH